MRPPKIVILGPQRLAPTIGDEIERLELRGRRIAVVTAGWQEREREDEELRDQIGDGEITNLELHRRAEALFEADAELAAMHRARQNELRALQKLYRHRLDYTLAPARQLLEQLDGPARWLAAERRASVSALRALDRQHQRRIDSIHRRFEAQMGLAERPLLAQQRAEIAAIVSDAAAVVIAGGHVAVLLNRLRLFDLGRHLDNTLVITWSAGAMALSEHVVLFHDAPPQGAGNAEIFENGLGVVPRLVPLPHARKRLRMEDPIRVALFTRRFAPARAVPLDERERLMWDGETWQPSAGLRQLRRDGSVVPFAEAAA